MSIGITAWLWMMAAALIPILIHLWSRKSGQPKILPTFRFLPEKSIARASRIELHEKTLLFLRILMILLITLLLAGLFLNDEPQQFNSVKLTESETGVAEARENSDVPELLIPSDRIDRLGWFRLLEQVEYDYRPGLIVVEGRLTANRFKGHLPELRADVDWAASDLQEMVKSSSWTGTETSAVSYIQRRSDMLTQNRIEPADSAGTANELDVLELIINSNADDSQKAGFARIAALWEVEMKEAEFPAEQLAIARYGDDEVRLNQARFDNTTKDYLQPGPHFGIELPVTARDSVQREWKQNRLMNDVITAKSTGEFQLMAVPEAPVAQWFYLGVANQLLKAAVGVDEVLEPEITEDQRRPVLNSNPIKAGWVSKQSATPFLLFMLLLVWAGERVLSNRRGM